MGMLNFTKKVLIDRENFVKSLRFTETAKVVAPFTRTQCHFAEVIPVQFPRLAVNLQISLVRQQQSLF
jgi:hypothetical protein